ncbi:hypothetical protein CSB69_2877 [Morganella morganii]|nr:hypothetical protein CSB69_2877 [Morganella morganii]EMP53076.1 hypothetical protein C790_03052 [Morganella morganii SC01]
MTLPVQADRTKKRCKYIPVRSDRAIPVRSDRAIRGAYVFRSPVCLYLCVSQAADMSSG